MDKDQVILAYFKINLLNCEPFTYFLRNLLLKVGI